MVSVLVEDFSYKKSENEKKDYTVLVLNEDEKSISGISLENLTQEEKEKVLYLHTKYCEDMKPFVFKAYRKFIKEKIITEGEKK